MSVPEKIVVSTVGVGDYTIEEVDAPPGEVATVWINHDEKKILIRKGMDDPQKLHAIFAGVGMYLWYFGASRGLAGMSRIDLPQVLYMANGMFFTLGMSNMLKGVSPDEVFGMYATKQ